MTWSDLQSVDSKDVSSDQARLRIEITRKIWVGGWTVSRHMKAAILDINYSKGRGQLV